MMNQRNPPAKRDNSKPNRECTIIKKDGRCTSVVGTGTKNACIVFVDSIKQNAKNIGVKLEGKYIILNHKVR